MNRSKALVADDALRNQDRVLEVIAVPRHERDQHVLAERELAHVGGGAVGDHVALGDQVTHPHQRTLIDIGVLIRTGVLDQIVNVDADFTGGRLLVVHAYYDAARVDVVDDAAAACLHRGARVNRNGALEPGADQRFFRAQARHRLALHVGAHQRTVRVVMLQKRDQGGRNRHDLRRRYVHILDTVRSCERELVLAAA